MFLHRQFAVENNIKFTNGIDWLNSSRAEIETHEVKMPELHQVGSGAEPDQFGLVWSSSNHLEEHQSQRLSTHVFSRPRCSIIALIVM